MIESPELTELEGKLDACSARLKTIFDQAQPGGEGTVDLSKVKDFGDKDAVLAEIRKTNDEMADLQKDRGELLDTLKALDNSNIDWKTESGDGQGRSPAAPTKSFGQLFAESAVRKGGIGVRDEIEYDLKTLMTRSAGWDPESLRDPGFVPLASAPIMALDLIPTSPTSQASIKYMEQTTRTNNAAERAEGAVYGEAAFVLTERSKPVESVGVWLPYTDEQMEDEEEAADMVDSELPLMVYQRLDSQVLVGNGTTPNIQGVNGLSGVQTQAKGADPTFDAVHKGMTKVRVTGRAMPSAVVFHPNDWEEVRLTRTTDGIYILGNPADAGPERIFGLRVAQSDNQTEHTAVVGDFANWSRLRVRRDIVVEKTNAHSDFFINGKQAVRAGLRVAAIWKRPGAFCTVTGI